MKKLLTFLIGLATLLPSCNKLLNGVPLYAASDSTQTVAMFVDSITHVITIYPSSSLGVDAAPEIDSAINYNNNHAGGYTVVAMPGNYYNYTPPLAANVQNGVYKQVNFTLQGLTDAQDAPIGATTNFFAMYDYGFGLGIQQGKSCSISNIVFIGRNTIMNNLNQVQIDTTAWDLLYDGVHSNNASAPYGGLVIDPYSDPKYYDGVVHQMYPNMAQCYIPGMGLGGSTAIIVQSCRMYNWSAGIVVTPSFQQNGDMMQFNSVRVDNCPSDFCFTQSQSKGCVINNPMSWGQSHTVFDAAHFGAFKSDGRGFPAIYGGGGTGNIAGINYEIFDGLLNSQSASINNLGAEGVFKIGRLYSTGGIIFTGCTFHLQQSQPNIPSPSFYWSGDLTQWNGCEILVYNGSQRDQRIVLNSQGNVFNGGSLGVPPVCRDSIALYLGKVGQAGNYPTVFNDVFTQYSAQFTSTVTTGLLSGNGWDSAIKLGTQVVSINPVGFTGSFLAFHSAGVAANDLITYYGPLIEDGVSIGFSYEVPMMYVTSVSQGSLVDTVYGNYTGEHCYSGNYAMWDMKAVKGY